MVAAIDGCGADPACRAAAGERARTLARPGAVQVLNYVSGTSYALTSSAGPTRVAWNTSGDDRPVVQCVAVRRKGLAFLGGTIVVDAIGPRIGGEASCPA
jgi:hypothetical protein